MKSFIFRILDKIIMFRYPTPNNNKIKAMILRLFGAKIGKNLFCDIFVSIRSPNKLTIGDNVVLSSFSVVSCAGGIEIGSNSMIGYNCNIISSNHNILPISVCAGMRFTGHYFSKVIIEEDCWIGSNVTILPGVIIRKGTIIAAGAVVTKTTNEYSIYAGVPAKMIKNRI